MNRIERALSALALAGLLLVLTAGSAHAAGTIPGINPSSQQSVGIFNQIMNTFVNGAMGWYTTIYGYAMNLFGALVGLEITWMGAMWALTRKMPEEVIPSFAKKVLMIGFFFFLLLNAQHVVYAIVQSFADIGLVAGNLHGGYLSPSTIIQNGFVGLQQIMSGGAHFTVAHQTDASSGGNWYSWVLHPATSISNAAAATVANVGGMIISFVTALIFFFAMFFVAMEYLMVEVEAAFVIAVGPLLLAAGGSRWTVHYSQSYLQYAVSVGIRLLVIELFVSLAMGSIMTDILDLLNQTHETANIFPSIAAMGAAMVLAVISRGLPKIASGILTGQSTASGDGLASAVTKTAAVGAGVVVGGAALAAGGIAGAGSAAGNALASRGAGSLGPGGGAGGGSPAGTMGPGGGGPAAPGSASVRAPARGPAGGGGNALNANYVGGSTATDSGASSSVPAPASGSKPSAFQRGVAKVTQAVQIGQLTKRGAEKTHSYTDAGSHITSHASVSAPGGNVRHADD